MSSETELHANITTRGQLEKDFHRLLVERVTEVIDRFRVSILEALEGVTVEIQTVRIEIDAVADATLAKELGASERRDLIAMIHDHEDRLRYLEKRDG